MLLIPLWHKDALKFPVFTTGLLGANLLVFLAAWPMQLHQASTVSQDELQRTSHKLVSVLLDPGSGMSDSNRVFLKGELETQSFPSPRLVEFLKQTQVNLYSLYPKARYEWDLTYPVFESYQRSIEINPEGTTVFKRWGFNPEHSWFPGLITHQFLHEGWMHLLFNLIFLWIAASIAEESLGLHMLWVYLIGGIVAAVSQVEWGGVPPGQSLIGASGAISALMGFCLFAPPQAKVKLLYCLFLSVLPRYGVFDSPLWFFLPIWLFSQLFMALMTAHKTTVNIAYAAHIGGFVFGCLAGLAFRYIKDPQEQPT